MNPSDVELCIAALRGAGYSLKSMLLPPLMSILDISMNTPTTLCFPITIFPVGRDSMLSIFCARREKILRSFSSPERWAKKQPFPAFRKVCPIIF